MGSHSDDHQRAGGDIGGEKIGEYLALSRLVLCVSRVEGRCPSLAYAALAGHFLFPMIAFQKKSRAGEPARDSYLELLRLMPSV